MQVFVIKYYQIKYQILSENVKQLIFSCCERYFFFPFSYQPYTQQVKIRFQTALCLQKKAGHLAFYSNKS